VPAKFGLEAAEYFSEVAARATAARSASEAAAVDGAVVPRGVAARPHEVVLPTVGDEQQGWAANMTNALSRSFLRE